MKFLRWSIPLLLIVISTTLGLWSRYQALNVWNSHKEFFYVENRPIFTAYDSYYFARLGLDFKEGIFKPGGEDKYRFVPDYGKYPQAIPFYSWLFVELASLFDTHIENVALWLIPILAVLVAVPTVLLFWKADLPFVGFGGALFGVLSLIYVVRTGIARLDTDSLVLFSMFALPFAVYYAFNSKSKRAKYLFLLLVALFSTLFYWGYFHPGLNLVLWGSSVLFLLTPWFLNLLKEKAFKKPSRELLLDLGLLTLAFNPVILIFGIISLLWRLYSYLFHFEKPIEGNFPNVQISISELQKLSLDQIAHITVGNKFALFIGFIGLAIFAVLRFRVFILLLPTLLIGLLSLKGASRFAMFLAPMLGIGIGIFVDLLWERLKPFFQNWKVEFATFGGLVALFTLLVYLLEKPSFRVVSRPIMSPSIAEAFIELGRQTPKNAWIWTWWDYGYAIQYYAHRATFHDGGSQFSPKTYFVALSFSTSNQTAAVNITKSVSVCGAKCIEKLLKKGYKPDQIKELFESGKLLKEKKPTHPVYWVFTRDLIGKYYWISYFGTWNFKTLKGEHIPISALACASKSPTMLVCNNRILVDLSKMHLMVGRNRAIPLKVFAFRTPQKLDINQNPYAIYGYAFEGVYTYLKDIYMWFILPYQGFNKTFNQLYILRTYSEKYFEKVKERFPDYLFYKVR